MHTSPESDLPLEGILVLDFSQFLAGPVAALRLADLGARVIKVERPQGGDIGRTLAFAGKSAGGDTLSFHAMNRNKEGITADLKNPDDIAYVKTLVAKADVVIENFRPGVMKRLGLDYEAVQEINPGIVYASATGYGETGPWKDRPGQDLLAQAVSGLPWLNGFGGDKPVPVGLAVADHLMSCHIAQGITALLVRRFRTGFGGVVQTSLLEAMLDLQFELLSTRLNDDSVTVERNGKHSAHAFLPAPYGTYPTSDGYIAVAMNPIPKLGKVLSISALEHMEDEQDWWNRQEYIEELLAETFATEKTSFWEDVLDAAGIWFAPVLTLEELIDHDGFAAIGMTQQITRHSNISHPTDLQLTTTRSPIRIDGETLRSGVAAPRLGEHNSTIRKEFTT